MEQLAARFRPKFPSAPKVGAVPLYALYLAGLWVDLALAVKQSIAIVLARGAAWQRLAQKLADGRAIWAKSPIGAVFSEVAA